jgi:hypothetical protein
MPLFSYRCSNNHTFDILCKHSDRTNFIICDICKEQSNLLVTLPAKTSLSWGDNTGKYGVDGFYDRGLGAHYHNIQERDKIAKEKGLVPVSDFGDNRVDSLASKQAEDQKFWNGESQRYKSNLEKFKGDQVKAVTETWTAHDILKGNN